MMEESILAFTDYVESNQKIIAAQQQEIESLKSVVESQAKIIQELKTNLTTLIGTIKRKLNRYSSLLPPEDLGLPLKSWQAVNLPILKEMDLSTTNIPTKNITEDVLRVCNYIEIYLERPENKKVKEQFELCAHFIANVEDTICTHCIVNVEDIGPYKYPETQLITRVYVSKQALFNSNMQIEDAIWHLFLKKIVKDVNKILKEDKVKE